MKSIFFISDRTGITNEALGNALLTQFQDQSFKKDFIPFVDSEAKAEQAIVKINGRYSQFDTRPIVFTSIMNKDIRDKFKLDYVCHIDFFEYFIPILEHELGQTASLAEGMSHGIHDEAKYYKRIDAIDLKTCQGQERIIYKFGESVMDQSSVSMTQTQIALSAFAEPIDLPMVNPYEGYE